MTETGTMANAMALHLVVSPIIPVKLKPISSTRSCKNRLRTVGYASAVICSKGDFDPDLRTVLDLATDSELLELEGILFGRSFFSPLLKSITRGANVDYAMIEEDLEERENFIAVLESRFLFLAADARSTLRGWRPSYRDVLLAVRRKLNIPCSNKLSTFDLEAEIFLYLLQEYSSGEESEFLLSLFELPAQSYSEATLQLGLSQWKVQGLPALKDGAAELRAMILKGGSLLTFAKAFQYLASKLSGKLFREAANYQIRKEIIRKGGQLAAVNIESRAALLAAKRVYSSFYDNLLIGSSPQELNSYYAMKLYKRMDAYAYGQYASRFGWCCFKICGSEKHDDFTWSYGLGHLFGRYCYTNDGDGLC